MKKKKDLIKLLKSQSTKKEKGLSTASKESNNLFHALPIENFDQS